MYFIASASIEVPSREFLGDNEERKIVNWFIKDKGKFLQQQYSTTRYKSPDLTQRLTEQQEKEAEHCMKVFQQLEASDTAALNEELPNFDLFLDFSL